MIIATYLGLAIAVSVASVLVVEVRGTLAVSSPASWVLALPLVFMFFLVLGLRASIRIPSDIDANWPFRLSQPSLTQCVNGAALVMLTLVVLPILLVTTIATVPMWPLMDVVTIAWLQLLAGVVLIEAVLFGWNKVPFACAHAPSPDVLKAWWPMYTLAMYLYAFKQATWQIHALQSRRTLAYYAAIVVTVAVVLHVVRTQKLRRQSLEFDVVPSHTVERLNLSEALN